MSKNTRTRILLTAVAALLLVVMSVGGTLAWLKAETTPVTNTFTTSDIAILLDESDNLDLKMIPGATIKKDPYVTVTTPDVDAYVFVKITKTNDFDHYMEYALADGWKVLSGAVNAAGDCVIYRDDVTANKDPQTFYILADDQVVVKDGVTLADMNTAKTAAPTLAFQAYVVQKDVGDVNAAWTLAQAAE